MRETLSELGDRPLSGRQRTQRESPLGSRNGPLVVAVAASA